MTMTDGKKIAELKEFMATKKTDTNSEAHLIAVLHKTQQLYNYLPEDIMSVIAEEMGIPTAHIWGVATFYHYFNLTPPGKHVISICMGTACYVKGAGKIVEALKSELKIEPGQVTEDGLFSLQEARCLGACGLAPVVMIDDKIYGELTTKKMIDLINDFRKKNKKQTKETSN